MSRSLVLLSLCLVLGAPLSAVPSATAADAASSGALAAAQPRTVAPTSVAAKLDRKRWKAPQGPFFNDPRRKKGWFRIERKVIDTIKHTRKGSTIRIAVYSFDRMPVANALIAAHRRGVKVQMILNDHQYTRAMRAVRKEIGAIARPHDIIFTADLPKTRSGKIMRRLLRDIAEGKTLGDTTTLADPSVVARLREQYQEEA